MKSFYLLSLGCSKNTVDSESMSHLLVQKGYQGTTNPELADLLIVNTCGFIQPARQETIDNLTELAFSKRPEQILIAAGCMTQLYAADVVRQVPKVDGVLGSRRWMDIIPLIDRIQAQRKQFEGSKLSPLFHLPEIGPADEEDNILPRVAIQGKSAYLKIAEGCRRACAYCAIPLIKGELVSRSRQAILSDASFLQDEGIKEIILIAQDTSDYGTDKRDGYRFTNLIRDILDQTPNVPWLRMLYAFPGCITDNFIHLMQENPRFLPYFDIPLQHAHPAILRSMNRPSNIDSTRTQIHQLKKEVPNLVLRTTFIVGYPGEGESEFQALLDFVKDIRFDRVGVFPFYYESGTPSAPLGDPVPEEVKQARIDQLMTLQQQISLEKNQFWVGKEMTILVEGVDAEQKITVGRSYRDAPEIDGLVFVEGIFDIGEMIQVRITDAMPYDLMAEPLKSNRRQMKRKP